MDGRHDLPLILYVHMLSSYIFKLIHLQEIRCSLKEV